MLFTKKAFISLKRFKCLTKTTTMPIQEKPEHPQHPQHPQHPEHPGKPANPGPHNPPKPPGTRPVG